MKPVEEEEKYPESPKKSAKSEAESHDQIRPKKIIFNDSPSKKNPHSDLKLLANPPSPSPTKSILVPQARYATPALSDLSGIEQHVVDKMRRNPSTINQLETALANKKRARRELVAAENFYQASIQELADLIAEPGDEDIADFISKR